MNILLKSCIGLFSLMTWYNAMAQDELTKNGVPIWVAESWAYQVQGSGTWIAENTRKSDQAPYDSYGLKWQYGPGKTTLKGRLYAIKAGQDVYTLWEFLNYWDPEQKKLLTVQYGHNPGLGNLALGETTNTGDINKSEQVAKVFKIDGTFYYIGHRSEHKKDEIDSRSFVIIDDQWNPRGHFVWKLVK